MGHLLAAVNAGYLQAGAKQGASALLETIIILCKFSLSLIVHILYYHYYQSGNALAKQLSQHALEVCASKALFLLHSFFCLCLKSTVVTPLLLLFVPQKHCFYSTPSSARQTAVNPYNIPAFVTTLCQQSIRI